MFYLHPYNMGYMSPIFPSLTYLYKIYLWSQTAWVQMLFVTLTPPSNLLLCYSDSNLNSLNISFLTVGGDNKSLVMIR